MDLARALPLLGGLSATEFMRTHWQKKPLLVRGAVVDPLPQLDRRRLFALAARSDVESRLVVNDGDRWTLRNGPLARRALPPVAQPDWTLLVQGVDLHDDAAHELLKRFRFIADARLDDAMLSFASDGGGVGPHIDSYDVFLLQTEGRRRWRVGRVARPRLRDDVPLKMLRGFVPTHEWLLEPGDMLYLPPGWGHEGTAEGPCITCSIGFRAPGATDLAGATLQRLAEAVADDAADRPTFNKLYADRGAAATANPARIPPSLQAFADAAIETALRVRRDRRRALGEVLSEPKPGTWFERGELLGRGGVALDRRTRMLYDADHVFINAESYRAGGVDAKLMHRLADERGLERADVRRLGHDARHLLERWIEAGWCVNRGSKE